ncbi:hypothetical protein L2E82_39495 [Cichorium intybus]|uniref:Uncharacterized protein n=1 Tax=Cichorium intybus TaxID=13427 RepID=A0ACB9AI65_CICIN|nr:hypothetical protein L2E82_39495 [Cichorium intybus]
MAPLDYLASSSQHANHVSLSFYLPLSISLVSLRFNALSHQQQPSSLSPPSRPYAIFTPQSPREHIYCYSSTHAHI